MGKQGNFWARGFFALGERQFLNPIWEILEIFSPPNRAILAPHIFGDFLDLNLGILGICKYRIKNWKIFNPFYLNFFFFPGQKTPFSLGFFF